MHNTHKTPSRLLAVALVALGAATVAQAQSLNARVDTRPLTPQEKTDYALPNEQVASGLNTVGVGQAVYLDALINSAIAPSNIVGVTWNLTGKPLGSAAALAASPLGANVPVYKMADRLNSQVAGRTMLRPDITGQYTVVATITTTTNSATLTNTITASTYLGANTCALCHSGGSLAANTHGTWAETPHATAFARKLDDPTGHFGQNCISCHVLGFDANTNAVNGGFDDVMASLGWTLPTTLTNGNYAAMPNALKNVSNIQCESCHGAGSQHAYNALFDVELAKESISVTIDSGSCAQCHDKLSHHFKSQEWSNSGHATPPTSPTGPTRGSCVACHSGAGFADSMNGVTPLRTDYAAIGCAACHDPHDASNPHQLRGTGSVTLRDGATTITTGGSGTVCMSCHMSRQNAATYVETTSGSSHFGPHYGCQTDMLMGVNAVTYGKQIPSSAHRDVIKDSCVSCHMQELHNGDAGFTHAGGHTFSMSWDGGGTNSPVHVTGACLSCHGPMEDFNLARQDYDGDGTVEGVQSEVKDLLHRLGRLLPPIGQDEVSITSAFTKQQLRAAFNYKFVEEDGSFGVHNVAYAVGLLKASIGDLTGDANTDGLPDAWQVQYFGSATSPNADPNATPANDGVPNWLKYALGLNPLVAGIVLPDGVVWANGGPSGNPEDPIRIYTAAEVVFNTQPGTSYQIQAISTLGGGWANVGEPIPGTGDTMSFLTPTRNNTQQFFRVVPLQ